SSPRYRGIASSPLRPSRSAGRSWCSVRAYTCPGSRGTPRAHVGGAQEGADPNTTTSSTAHVKTRRTLLPALRCRLRPRTRSRLGQGSTELLAAWLDLNHANTTRRDTAPRHFGHRIGDVRLADDPLVVQQRNVELRRLFRPVLEPEERDNLPHGGFVLSKRDGSSIVDRGRRVGAAFAVDSGSVCGAGSRALVAERGRSGPAGARRVQRDAHGRPPHRIRQRAAGHAKYLLHQAGV